MKTLFSLEQIVTAAFLSGPLSAIYMVSKNFKSRNEQNKVYLTMVIGAFLFYCLFFLSPKINENSPNFFIPLLIILFIRFCLRGERFSKNELFEDNERIISNWKVFRISILSLVLTLLTVFGIMFSNEDLIVYEDWNYNYSSVVISDGNDRSQQQFHFAKEVVNQVVLSESLKRLYEDYPKLNNSEEVALMLIPKIENDEVTGKTFVFITYGLKSLYQGFSDEEEILEKLRSIIETEIKNMNEVKNAIKSLEI